MDFVELVWFPHRDTGFGGLDMEVTVGRLPLGRNQLDNATGKRKYSRPTLVVYGSVREFTHVKSENLPDEFFAMRMHPPG
jgi:hypothetical protein